MASKISINLDTSKENYILVKCNQNDDLTLEAFIYENGLDLDLTNKIIIIKALKADGTYISQNTKITKSTNKIIAELERDFTRAPGTTKIEILLIEGGKNNTTFSFYLEVRGSVIKGAVESSNTVTILEELDNKTELAIQVKEETEQLIESGGAATKGDIQKVNASLEESINQINLLNLFNGNPKCVAHKGCELLAPEGTYQAYLKAGEIGFWGAECDIQWTSDNIPILYHDELLSTFTNGTGDIPSKTLSQVKALNFTSGNKLNTYGNGLKICTFEDYLKICKKYNMHCFIELKFYNTLTDDNINSLISLIEKYKMEKYSIIMHINKNVLLRCRVRNKNIPLLFMVADDHSQNNIEWIANNQPCYVGCNFSHTYLTQSVIDTYHNYNIPVVVYTVDKLFDAQLWTKKGVDILVSKIFVGGEV